MAEEDDARIRILQSLRGKICKFEWRVAVFHLSQWGKRSVEEASGVKEGKPEGHGVLSTVDRGGRDKTVGDLLPGAYRQVTLACYQHLTLLTSVPRTNTEFGPTIIRIFK